MQSPMQAVYTNKARCRDCYRCIRACPVKAIKMHESQAFVLKSRCIECGSCIRECPQKAKTFRSDLDWADDLIKSEEGKVIATVAPSFACVYRGWKSMRLPSALRQLGFDMVTETAAGANIVAKETAEYIEQGGTDKPYICTACPTVVSLIEKYHVDAAQYLVPVVSPMIAHGMLLREKFGENSKIIFIGPCIAKKTEAQRPEYKGIIDCVITFEELAMWFENEKIDLVNCEESFFDDVPGADGRYFPINGGIIRCAKIEETEKIPIFTVSGAQEVIESVKLLETKQEAMIVDPLFCMQGCINGPAINSDKNVFERKKALVEFAQSKNILPPIYGQKTGELKSVFDTFFAPQDVNPDIDESEIREILERTGKADEETQLNCGACGYDTCRDKAIAVLRGLAEEEMCIPLMKKRAEQKSDFILEHSPNGVVLLDDKLNILSMNKAFKKFFMAGDSIVGRHISYLIDPDGFEQLVSQQEELVEGLSPFDKYGITCHYLLYPIKETNQFAGIFVNVTSTNMTMQKLENIQKDTVELAQTLLNHEIEAAQKFAALLGENAAKTEHLVKKFLELAKNEKASEKDAIPWKK